MTTTSFVTHSSHWGTFTARYTNDGLEIVPFGHDPDPSELLANVPASLNHPARLSTPLVRRGWLEEGPGPDPRRGSDEFVAVSFDQAFDLAAAELKRLGAGPDLPKNEPLPGANVFGGSYGWSSAGRFHHAQSQVHRFLNSAFGGYVASVDTYSSAAGAVILDLVWGNTLRMVRQEAYWDHIANKTELLIAFGGVPLRNLAVSPGGNSQHIARRSLEAATERGCEFVSVSPLADDFEEFEGTTRIAPRPGTDVALMLGMAYHLRETGNVDHAYLTKYTVGYERFEAYLSGKSDSVAKTPEWASGICGVSASDIRCLAERAASRRTHITISYALQRARHGEQPVWMALTLAAMLGQYNLEGGGFSYSLASIGNVGKPPLNVPLPTFPQGENRVSDFIPVARIAELLQNPGKSYTYKCETRTYADIQLVYWAGGNPFHHHQDLASLQRAFSRPDTIIVHDSVGTATARHADIVFPATVTLEREDTGASGNDPFLIPMQKLVEPLAGAMDDYDIFAELARRIGVEERFTEGRTSRQWLAAMYEPTRAALAAQGFRAPDFESFMGSGEVLRLPVSTEPSRIARFHADPDAYPLDTQSGRIEIFSERIEAAGFCGHPAWLKNDEWLGAERAATYPFQLIANQPRGRLHSQLDFGAASMKYKHEGREVLRMNAKDAEALNVADGDIVRVFNNRGGFLAAVMTSAALPRQTIQISTGAWYAPLDLDGAGLTCVNGNPNTVTSDAGSSGLGQGCAGQLTLVDVERWSGAAPAVVTHENILKRTEDSILAPSAEAND